MEWRRLLAYSCGESILSHVQILTALDGRIEAMKSIKVVEQFSFSNLNLILIIVILLNITPRPSREINFSQIFLSITSTFPRKLYIWNLSNASLTKHLLLCWKWGKIQICRGFDFWNEHWESSGKIGKRETDMYKSSKWEKFSFFVSFSSRLSFIFRSHLFNWLGHLTTNVDFTSMLTLLSSF